MNMEEYLFSIMELPKFGFLLLVVMGCGREGKGKGRGRGRAQILGRREQILGKVGNLL